MSYAAFGVSIVALVVSAVGLVYSRSSARASARSAEAAERSTEAAVAADRRARTPRLVIVLGRSDDVTANLAIYTIRNDGPQDLDSVRVYRPRPADGLTYPIAVTGHGWAEDDIELGLLALNGEARFTLSCGSRAEVPEFRVRIESQAGADMWTQSALLDGPRPPKGPTLH